MLGATIAGFLLLFAAGLLAVVAAFRSAAAERWVTHSIKVRQTLQQLFSEAQDLRIAQRPATSLPLGSGQRSRLPQIGGEIAAQLAEIRAGLAHIPPASQAAAFPSLKAEWKAALAHFAFLAGLAPAAT